MQSPPKRTLRLTSPLAHGEDVRRLQVAINARRRAGHVAVDGEYGPTTAHEAKVTALALGIASGGIANGLGKHAQTIIRAPGRRTPLERYRAKVRARNAAKAQQGAAGAVKYAIELCSRNPHVTETDGRNTDYGGIIDQMQKGVGMSRQPWCGAFVHFCLKHAGIEVTPEVRYCPSTEAHAKNGTGGFRDWVPAHGGRFAPAGALALFGSGEAKHVALLVDDWHGESTIKTAEGNTSSGPEGSQDNGGGAFLRARPIDGGFPVRGFAIPRGIA
jgi:hypothetical protein